MTKRVRGGRRVIVAALASALLMILLVAPASAHTGDQTYLYMDVTEQTLSGRVEAPVPDVVVALGLDDEGLNSQQIVDANQDAIIEYLHEHLVVSVDGQTWPVEFDSVALFYSDLPEADDNYLVAPFTVTVQTPDGVMPRNFDLQFDPFVDEINDRSSLLLIGNDWQGGVIDNGFETLTAFDAGSRSQEIDLGEASWFKNFTSSIKLGADHIRTGPDHILFVLVLLLPAVLVFNKRWWPATGFVSSLWRVLKIVTMFTVAHSITFTLAGLDILPLPPSKLVEFIIALSIAAAAIHNIRPLFPNKEWLLAFVFGLFHGMGFASLVEGLDVSRSTQLVSLLGRNLGIEIGQAAVVLLLFPALYLLRRTRFYRPFFVAASMVMALVSLVWMIERLGEVDLGINSLVDPVFAWPRILFIVIALTLVAAAYRQVEGSNNRLLPTIGSDDSTSGSSADLEQKKTGSSHGAS